GTATYMQITSECTGIKESASGNMSVEFFPNPSNGSFTVNCDQAGEKLITLIDISGKIVYSFTSYDTVISVHAGHLASGMYTATVKCNSGLAIGKIIVH